MPALPGRRGARYAITSFQPLALLRESALRPLQLPQPFQSDSGWFAEEFRPFDLAVAVGEAGKENQMRFCPKNSLV